jgi:hypothetical protein
MGLGGRRFAAERVCCLLVLNSVTSTPQWIRQPRPRGLTLTRVDERVDAIISAKTTDDIDEGLTNIYFTEERVDTRISSKTTDDIDEGTTDKYFTDEKVNTKISAKTTDDIDEGLTNKYFTDERVDTVLEPINNVIFGSMNRDANGDIIFMENNQYASWNTGIVDKIDGYYKKNCI